MISLRTALPAALLVGAIGAAAIVTVKGLVDASSPKPQAREECSVGADPVILAYASRQNAVTSRIHVLLAGGTRARITDSGRLPALSPDGKYVAFERTNGAGGNAEIRIVCATGSISGLVATGNDPHWLAPDRLLYTSGSTLVLHELAGTGAGATTLYEQSDGEPLRSIVAVAAGRHILVESAAGHHLVDATTRTARTLPGRARELPLAWSPRNDWLLLRQTTVAAADGTARGRSTLVAATTPRGTSTPVVTAPDLAFARIATTTDGTCILASYGPLGSTQRRGIWLYQLATRTWIADLLPADTAEASPGTGVTCARLVAAARAGTAS